MPGALTGLRVVELSNALTGAQVGQLLADYGADVVLVEPPGGSPLRTQPAFPSWARGKQSVELDLTTGDGRAALWALAVKADVVIDSFRPGVAERLGLGYDELAIANPAVVYASITGFGTTGPYAGVQGYEALVMAKVGGFQAFSGLIERPGPAYVSTPFASWSATQACLQGILVALYERDASGRGQRVEMNLAKAVACLDPWGWMVHWLTQQYPDAFHPAPPVGDDLVPNSSFTFRLLIALTADDRWLQFSQVQPHLFRALMRALDLEWMYEDPAWKTVPELDDPARRVEFWRMLLEGVRSKTLAEWQALFEHDHDLWAEVYRSGSELLHHPQVRHNRMVSEIDDPDLGPVLQLGALVRLDGTPAALDRPAPRLGQHEADLWADGHVDREREVVDPPTGALPLDGVTVLELGTFYASPFGATLLTDLGARVVKMEPIAGDPIRMMVGFPEASGVRVLQGKESVAIDIATDEGRAIVHELARRSDLVLQSFRADVAERLGVDDATLLGINPDLVYLNAPGYGVDGPNGHCPAFAPTIGAGAGFAMRNLGLAAPSVEGLTIDELRAVSLVMNSSIGFAQADGVAALAVATGLLLGLVARQRGAGGQSMLTSMLTSGGHFLSEDMVEYVGKAPLPMPDAQLLGMGPLYRLYETADGWVFLAAPSDREWDRLRQALAPHVTLAPDARDDLDGLAGALEALFATASAERWEKELLAADVGCVAVSLSAPEANYITEGFGEAHGFVVEVDHPVFGTHPRLAPLVGFSRSAVVAKAGCAVGQHTDAVLEELGYSSDRIADLRASGVIG